jgi:hypothetical protein
MTPSRYGDHNAVGRALTEETDRRGGNPWILQANEAKRRMTPNFSDAVKHTIIYCRLVLARDRNCKWWQWRKRREYNELIEHYYPLMAGEIGTLTRVELKSV